MRINVKTTIDVSFDVEGVQPEAELTEKIVCFVEGIRQRIGASFEGGSKRAEGSQRQVVFIQVPAGEAKSSHSLPRSLSCDGPSMVKTAERVFEREKEAPSIRNQKADGSESGEAQQQKASIQIQKISSRDSSSSQGSPRVLDPSGHQSVQSAFLGIYD